MDTRKVPAGTGEAAYLLEDDIESQLLQAQLEENPADNSGWQTSFKNAATSFGRGVVDTMKAVGAGVATGFRHLTAHPFASVIGFLNAAPTALYALTGPSGASPEKIGSAWWYGMSVIKRIYSVSCGGASFAINGIMNAKFLVFTPKKVKSTVLKTFNSPSDFIVSTGSLVISLSSATGAAMLSYKSFTWLPYGEYTAAILGAGAGLVLAITRYPSIADILKKPALLFKNRFRFQRKLADKLEHINHEHLATVENELSTIIAELREMHGEINPVTNQAAYEEVLKRLTEKLDQLGEMHPNLINATSNSEYVKYYTGVLFDTTMALTLFAAPTFITFTQNGYDAVNLISKYASKNTLDELNKGLKILIGLPCGIASAMFYFNSGLKLRDTAVDVVSELYSNPKKIPAYLLLCATNGLASGSMFNVAHEIITKTNIFNLTDNAPGSTYRIAQGIGGVFVNTIITSREALLDHRENTVEPLSVAGIAAQLRLEDEVLSDESCQQLGQLGLFGRKDRAMENNTPVYDLIESDQEEVIFNV